MSSFSYDPATDIGRVRLLIQDWDVRNVGGERGTWSCVFTDEELAAILADWGTNAGRYFWAACTALTSIAADASKLAVRVRIGDYEEEPDNIAIQLRQQAGEFRTMALQLDSDASDVPADAVAEMAWDDFTQREILRNYAARGW